MRNGAIAQGSARVRAPERSSADSQFREGKMPSKAMMQVMVMYGCMFSCGWLLPVVVITEERRVVSGVWLL